MDSSSTRRAGRTVQHRAWLGPLVGLILLFWTGMAWALVAEEVLVVANRNASASIGLAKYYMEKRGIPAENLVQLWITDKETCTRDAYERKVVPRIRRALEANTKIRALVTLYGVPLRIVGPQRPETPVKPGEKAPPWDTTAAFDSELSLVLHQGYALNFWQPNPFYIGFQGRGVKIPKSEVMMVSRLDGSSPQLVRRIIDDALFAEKNGLEGKMYLDARWKDPGKKKVKGYQLYDRSLHLVARHHRKNQLLPVTLNDEDGLFGENACPQTALYCGWYSLARYVDSFEWSRGAVGYHMASSECATLKKTGSTVWCKNILEHGAAATIGPVGEPYIQGFPMPEVFFNLLTEGYLTLVEAYTAALPYLSWKMVLVGDPLYRIRLK